MTTTTTATDPEALTQEELGWWNVRGEGGCISG